MTRSTYGKRQRQDKQKMVRVANTDKGKKVLLVLDLNDSVQDVHDNAEVHRTSKDEETAHSRPTGTHQRSLTC